MGPMQQVCGTSKLVHLGGVCVTSASPRLSPTTSLACSVMETTDFHNFLRGSKGS
jgi:hypothetical protein